MLIVTNYRNNEYSFNILPENISDIDSAKKRYEQFKSDLSKVFVKNEKQKVLHYWNLGLVIRDFIEKYKINKDFTNDVFKSARSLFDDIDPNFANDSQKRKRIMAHQLYILSGYSKQNVLKTSWSTWTYLFQNRYLNEISELHKFLENKLSDGLILKEGFFRVFIMIANQLFNKVNLDEWSYSEIKIPIDISFNLIMKISKSYDLDDRILRKKIFDLLKEILKNNHSKYLTCFSDNSKIIEFEDFVLKQLLIKNDF